MSNIYLSPHFTLQEFVVSQTARDHGIKNEPAPEHVENLRALCVNTLEPLREALGLPIIITSGYRCKALNHLLVCHSNKSQHMEGEAADFVVQNGQSPSSKIKVQGSNAASSKIKGQGESSRELLIKAFRLIILDESIDYDQLILYPTFIHVSYVSRERNRHKLTRAFANGKYAALTRAQALALE